MTNPGDDDQPHRNQSRHGDGRRGVGRGGLRGGSASRPGSPADPSGKNRPLTGRLANQPPPEMARRGRRQTPTKSRSSHSPNGLSSRAARSTTPGAASRSLTGTGRSRARALVTFLERIGITEVVIFGLTVGISVWSWLTFVVRSPQDFPTFAGTFLIVNLVGAAVQMIFYLFVRPQGSLTARLTLSTTTVSHAGSFVVYWAPTPIYTLMFLALTPPDTSGAGFDPGTGIYQVILIMLLLGLLATLVGAALFYCLVVLPLVMILRGILPEAHDATGRPTSSISRTQYASMGLFILAIVLFAVSMTFVAPGANSPSSYGRMGQQFETLISLSGVRWSSIVAFASLTAMVVLGVINNRAADRRMEPLTDPRIQPGEPRMR